MRVSITLAVIASLIPALSPASVVDATDAEKLYQAGEYKDARAAFVELLEEFSAASKDSTDYRPYRELTYLYDRLADCCFTQRDWVGLKLYVDGMHEVSAAELSLVESQLSGALLTGVATATAQYLYDRVDESVRLSSITQIKRSIGLILLDTRGEGETGAAAIRQYQALAAVLADVLEVQDGRYALDVQRLEQNLANFDAIQAEIEQLADLESLWQKHLPARASVPHGEVDEE
jgi:hypothetical protein